MALLLACTAVALSAPGSDIVGEAWVYAPTPIEQAALRTQPVGFGEGIEKGWVRVLGSAQELDSVETAGFVLRDRRPDHRIPRFFDEAYHSPESMADALVSLANEHPEKARLVQIGESLEGRPILALDMGDTQGSAWRLLGTHHGDELASAELVLAIARSLLTEVPGFEGLLSDRRVLAVPHLNPDGVAAGTRYNARGVDLNRNYDFHWRDTEYRPGEAPFSEPETRAVRTLSLHSSFHAGLSIHSGATNIGYVWNYTTLPTADAPLLESFGARYLNACTQEGFWLTNGASWYITRGDTNDWSYGRLGTLDYTLEVSPEKTPSAAALDQLLAEHLPAAAAWLSTETPLSGQTIDQDSGAPVPALLELLGASPPFPSDPVHGGFSRVLAPGSYTLRAMAPGYQVTLVDLQLEPGESLYLPLALVPHRLAEGTPVPQLLSMGADTVDLHLPDHLDWPDRIRLERPGVPTVEVAREGDVYPVTPALLTTGPLTVVAGDAVLPRAIFAGSLSERVRIESVEENELDLVLHGHGFGAGTRVLGLWGLERAAHEIPITFQSPTTLELDIRNTPGQLDLWILSNGTELTVLDARQRGGLDTSAPPDTGGWDTATHTRPHPGAVDLIPVSACETVPRSPARWTALLALLVAMGTRRPQRCTAHSSS